MKTHLRRAFRRAAALKYTGLAFALVLLAGCSSGTPGRPSDSTVITDTAAPAPEETSASAVITETAADETSQQTSEETQTSVTSGAAAVTEKPTVSDTAPVSADGKPEAGMNLLEAFAAAYGGEYASFAEGFEPEKYSALELNVNGEASETYRVYSKEIMSELYGALRSAKIEGPYDSDEMAADSSLFYRFIDTDGSALDFYFDIGRPSINKELYNITDKKALSSARSKITDAAMPEGKPIILAYSDMFGGVYTLAANGGEISAAVYRQNDGAKEYISEDEGIINELTDALWDGYMNGFAGKAESEKEGEQLGFIDRDGNYILFRLGDGTINAGGFFYYYDNDDELAEIIGKIKG